MPLGRIHRKRGVREGAEASGAFMSRNPRVPLCCQPPGVPTVPPPESQSGQDSLARRAECRVRPCASKGAARPHLPCVLKALWQGQTSVWGENCSTLENTWASASLEAALALRGLWAHEGRGRMDWRVAASYLNGIQYSVPLERERKGTGWALEKPGPLMLRGRLWVQISTP